MPGSKITFGVHTPRPSSARMNRQDTQDSQFRGAKIAARPLTLAVHLTFAVSAIALLGCAPVANAQQGGASAAQIQAENARHFDIPAGPLSKALTQFSTEAGIFLVGATDQAQGKSSPGVRGELSVRAALYQLLAGTGLQAQPNSQGQYVLQEVSGTTTLPPVRVFGTAIGATTEGTGSYATENVTLFGGEQSLKDIPQSVTVVTRQQMDDQRLDTLDEVLENTPGITLFKRPGGGSDIYSRGFLTNTIQYDGVPLYRANYWGNSFAASSVYLDRVEVLRGAQGLLEGAGDPAGAVNVVRKRGLADKAFNIDGRVGSWDNYGTRVETGGALDEQSRLRSRVVLDYEDKDSFVDTISDRNFNAYGALDFDLTPDTTLGLGIAYSLLKGNGSLYRGVPRYADGQPLDVSRSTYPGADWNDAERRETQVFLDLEHRFSEDWKLSASGIYIEEDWESRFSAAHGLVAVGTSTVNGTGYDYDYSASNAGMDIQLSGRLETLGLSHDLVLGGNYSKQKRDDGYSSYQYYMTYDVFNIDHHAPKPDPTDLTGSSFVKHDTEQKGIYTMLRSHLTDQLTTIVGARSSWYEQTSNGMAYWGAIDSVKKETGELTPYAGVVYSVTPEWSVYASYADIFQPQTSTDAQQQVLEPIIGSNYEIGIKGELFNGALNTAAAIYRIDQENRAVPDTIAPPVCGSTGTSTCSRAAGKVRSEGFELEAHGELLPGWQISGGYTYNRNEYLKDGTASNIGKPFSWDTPKHILRLWSDYQFSGTLNRWSAGAGVNYRSEQKTASTTIQRDPVQGGYSVWNARVAYQIDNNWSASLNINNVFDKHYYAFLDDPWYYSNYFGEPRNFTLTVSGSF